MKGEKDNPTIGILLCTETDKTMARYSVLHENKQLFASQYMNYLPSEKELEKEIDFQKELFLSQQKKRLKNNSHSKSFSDKKLSPLDFCL